MITAEPAVVVPLEDDEDAEGGSLYSESNKDVGSVHRAPSFRLEGLHQPGQMLWRASHAMQRRNSLEGMQSMPTAGHHDLMAQRYGGASPRKAHLSPRHAMQRRVAGNHETGPSNVKSPVMLRKLHSPEL